MGELVNYRGHDPVTRRSSRNTGLWLMSTARQALFMERLLGELTNVRLENLGEAHMKVVEDAVDLGTDLRDKMEASRDNPFVLDALEEEFATWKACARHILTELATRRLI